MQSNVRLAIATATLILVGACGLTSPVPSDTVSSAASSPSPVQTPDAFARLEQTLSLSAATPSPSSRPADFWLSLPFPEPLRAEPDGDPTVVLGTTWDDATGDGRPADVDLVDIVSLAVDAPCYSQAVCVNFDIGADGLFALGDPTAELVAYGLVIDDDGDGFGDRRVGADNAWYRHRLWTIDLDGSGTVAYDYLAPSGLDAWVPSFGGPPQIPEHLGGWIGVDEFLGELPRFYFWATVIRDGEVASTDFAPDVGWLSVSES